MKNKVSRYTYFNFLFFVMILIPLLLTNHKKDQNSSFDNKPLPELPHKFSSTFFKEFEDYFNYRIGLREASISAYQVINDKLFGIIEHPVYMRGQNSHIYFKGKDYLDDYQHTNIDTEYINTFVEYLSELNRLVEAYGAKFTFALIPDKKTVYPEFFPVGINRISRPSRAETLMEKVSGAGIDNVFLASDFLAKKNAVPLYNAEFDVGHWNGNGEFFGQSLIIRHLNSINKKIPLLDAEDYHLDSEIMTSLLVSKFPISERVPIYQLKHTNAKQDSETLSSLKLLFPSSNMDRWVTPVEDSNGVKILVFGDSYFGGSSKYYINQFSEYTFIHMNNLPLIRYYLEKIKPDIVLLESAERVIGGSNYRMLDNTIISQREFPTSFEELEKKYCEGSN